MIIEDGENQRGFNLRRLYQTVFSGNQRYTVFSRFLVSRVPLQMVQTPGILAGTNFLLQKI